MPRLRLEDSREIFNDAGEVIQKSARTLWDGFSDFALQENVVGVAVGLILASAFTSVVTSFVSDILLPPLSLLPFINRNMDEKFAVLRPGKNYHNGTHGHGYNTLSQALSDGAVVMAYGSFLNKIINFVGVGFALYALASIAELAAEDPIIKHTVKCKYCRKRINVKAKRCINCTSWQDGREEKNEDHGDHGEQGEPGEHSDLIN